ncbi:MAG: glyoxalase [Rhodococcus sp.]|nr:glyoxalase [Rhodococcus sp. (in: high G+C Gram-positive bacteria)]
MNALYPAICAHDVPTSRDFYARLFGLDIVFDSGWYVQLVDRANPTAQIGIIEQGHATVPDGYQGVPAGVLVSIEVDDATALHEHAVESGLQIAMTLRDEDFGQRHFMTVDPDGLLVDVIELTPMRGEFADSGLNGAHGVVVDR